MVCDGIVRDNGIICDGTVRDDIVVCDDGIVCDGRWRGDVGVGRRGDLGNRCGHNRLDDTVPRTSSPEQNYGSIAELFCCT